MTHDVAPAQLPGAPFEFVDMMRRKYWRESALWWPETQTLVTADALLTNRFHTGGTAPIGVHILLRFTPPTALGELDPVRVLVGHGEGIVGPGAARDLRDALRSSRRRLPGVLLRMPFAIRVPSRPR